MGRRSFQQFNAENQAALHFSPACAPEDIICSGSDTEESDGRIRQKRLRYEEQARRCIHGRLPVLQSASLRGPLDRKSGWINPWRYRKPESPNWWQPGSEEMLFTRSNVMKRAADHGLGYLTPGEALTWCRRTAIFEVDSAESSSSRIGMVESNNGGIAEEEKEEEGELAAFSKAAQVDNTLMGGTGQGGVKRPAEWLKGSYVSKRARWDGPSISTPTPLNSNGRDGQRQRNMVPNGSAISWRSQRTLESSPLPAPQNSRSISLEPSQEQGLISNEVNIPQHSPHHKQSVAQQEPARVSHHGTLSAEDSLNLMYEDTNIQILREDLDGNILQDDHRDPLDLSQISPFVVSFGSPKLDINLQTSTPNYKPRCPIEMPDWENSSRGFEELGSSNHSLPKLPPPTTATTASKSAHITPTVTDEGSFLTEIAPSSWNVEEFQFKKKRRYPKIQSPVRVTVESNSETVMGIRCITKNQRPHDDPKLDPVPHPQLVESIIPENQLGSKYHEGEPRESTSRVAIDADEKDTNTPNPLQDTPDSEGNKQRGLLHNHITYIPTNPSQTKMPTPNRQGKGKLTHFAIHSLASPSQKSPSLPGQIFPSQSQSIAEPTNLLKACDPSAWSLNTTLPKSIRSVIVADMLSNPEIQDEEHQEVDIELQGYMSYKDRQPPGESDHRYSTSKLQPRCQHTSQDLKGALVDARSLSRGISTSKGQTSEDDLVEETEACEAPPCPSDGTSQSVDVLVSQSPPKEATRTPVPHSQVVEPGAQTPWAKIHTQSLPRVPVVAPELGVAVNPEVGDFLCHLEEPEEPLQEQPQSYEPADGIGWHPIERSMTPDSNHIKLLKDLMTPPSPTRRSQTINGLPDTRLIFGEPLENPWGNKGKEVGSISQKTMKRVSFENLPLGEDRNLEDYNPIPAGTIHSPPPPVELEEEDDDDDDDILKDVPVEGFGNHFRAARRATRSIASSSSGLLCSRSFKRLIPEQEDNTINNSPSVSAMAEAFIAADREASLGLQQNSPTSISRHSKPRIESTDNTWKQSNSSGRDISGTPNKKKIRNSSLLLGFEMDEILGEVDGYLEHWSVDAELEKARQQQSEAEGNGAKRKRLFGIV